MSSSDKVDGTLDDTFRGTEWTWHCDNVFDSLAEMDRDSIFGLSSIWMTVLCYDLVRSIVILHMLLMDIVAY